MAQHDLLQARRDRQTAQQRITRRGGQHLQGQRAHLGRGRNLPRARDGKRHIAALAKLLDKGATEPPAAQRDDFAGRRVILQALGQAADQSEFQAK